MHWQPVFAGPAPSPGSARSRRHQLIITSSPPASRFFINSSFNQGLFPHWEKMRDADTGCKWVPQIYFGPPAAVRASSGQERVPELLLPQGASRGNDFPSPWMGAVMLNAFMVYLEIRCSRPCRWGNDFSCLPFAASLGKFLPSSSCL